MESNSTNENIDKHSNGKGCLITITIMILFIIIGFAITYFITQKTNPDNNQPNLLSRSATLNDITISGDDLDLAAFGEKLTFTPKKDISGLKLKFIFQKSDGTQLQTIEKSIGNVKEGQQYSVTISITELKWDVIKNAFDLQCKYTVSAGTVSYFA
ncbi:MAG: hypothetical protein K2O39_02500 [Clostridiales bacterium]|nr:hypothetical protein [Clostridiales bacterium]